MFSVKALGERVDVGASTGGFLFTRYEIETYYG